MPENENELQVSVVTDEVVEQHQEQEMVEQPVIEQPAEQPIEVPASEEQPIEQPQQVAEVEMDDDKVLKYLADKYELSVESIEALKPKEPTKLPPSVEAYEKFVKETGNENISDFLATQKDWSGEPNDVKLMELLKIENPFLNKQELEYLYNKRYSTDGLVEYIDESEIMEKQINQKIDLKKADELLEQRKQSYMVRKGLDELVPEEFKQAKQIVDNFSAQQKEANDFNALKANEYFNDEFKGFEYQIKVGDKAESFV